MKRAHFLSFILGISIAVQLGAVSISHAFELTGAWAQDKSVCAQLFTRKERAIAFSQDSELWGKGFIVDGNSIRGQNVQCTIRSKREGQAEIHLLASCASDIMVDQIQFTFKTAGADSITRIFPGLEGLESTFVRCSF